MSFFGLQPRSPRIRDALAAALLVTMTVVFAALLHRHVPLGNWLFFRYAAYFATAALPLLAAFALGDFILGRLLRVRWRSPERFSVGLAIGLFFFVLGWAGLGFLRLLGPVTFVLWPLACMALLLPGGARRFRRLRTLARLQSRRGLTTAELLLGALGVVGLLLVYAPLVTPQNIAFDARWYHLPIAERYAVEGAIVPFREGWLLGGYPHLASILYSWCFCAPFTSAFDRVELVQHVEFLVFLATLTCLPSLVLRLLPRAVRLPRFTWAFVFFFPELFVYDSNLNGGADHVAAFWAAPLFLVTLRAYRQLSTTNVTLLSVLISAVALTKYTALGLLLGPGLALTFRVAVDLVRRKDPARTRAAWRAPLLVVGLTLLFTSPHWLKNWIWYGNPAFPLLPEVFSTHPWNPEAQARMNAMLGDTWAAPHTLQGVATTLSQLYSFSFVPSDWPTFHRNLPMFGSLFTLLTPLLLLARTRRLLGLVACANVGVLFWYWTFHQDRYLQAYLPWMAASVAASVLLLWRSGVFTRVGLIALMTLQLAWGGDAPFLGTHTMAGQPIQKTIEFVSQGFRGNKGSRFVAYDEFEKLGSAAGPKATILRHEMQVHLGMNRPSVGDWFQSGISWSRTGGPRGMDETLRSYGVTHLVWRHGSSFGWDSVGSDLVFFHYALNHGRRPQVFGGYTLVELPEAAPTKDGLDALVLGCGRDYANGLYSADQLTILPHHGAYPRGSRFPSPRVPVAHPSASAPALTRADAVIWNQRCFPLERAPSSFGLTKAAKRGEETIWVRKRASPAR